MARNTKRLSPGTSSLIIGIIMTLVNIGMICALFGTGSFFAGGLLIVFPILGVVNGIQALKEVSIQKILGIIGLILNIFATIGSLGFGVLYIITKFVG